LILLRVFLTIDFYSYCILRFCLKLEDFSASRQAGSNFVNIRYYGAATAEYLATIVPDSTCAHIFKERDMCSNNLTQVAGYSAVKQLGAYY